MKIADIPTKFDVPFAVNAGVGFKRSIPKTSQIGITPGAASLNDGFPPVTFQQIAAGGTPPWGADMNGLMYQATLWLRWATAGGVPVKYDATFSTTIGGYPKGALLQASSFTNQGRYWVSAVDDNTTNPDTGGANWIPFPDVNVQLQTPNYAVDTGITNEIRIALSRTPASFAELVGAPVRFKVANANSITNPTIDINGTGQKVMVNPDGSALSVAQLIVGGVAEGIPRDDDKFQLNFPTPATAPGATWPIPGVVMPWFNETVPSGFLELNGATLLISSYPALYGVLATRYGGDGVNNFKLPDCRGTFIRGWDHGRGLDPGRLTRTNAGGGITGDHVGTNQAAGVNSLDVGGIFRLLDPHANVAVIVNQSPNRFDTDYPLGSGIQPANIPPVLQPPYISFTNNALSNINFPPGGSNPPPGGSSATDIINYLWGTAQFVTSTGNETRPVNIYAMWVMAY